MGKPLFEPNDSSEILNLMVFKQLLGRNVHPVPVLDEVSEPSAANFAPPVGMEIAAVLNAWVSSFGMIDEVVKRQVILKISAIAVRADLRVMEWFHKISNNEQRATGLISARNRFLPDFFHVFARQRWLAAQRIRTEKRTARRQRDVGPRIQYLIF